ncbi:MAG: FkbM family methyltransferase, partial [Pseudomonadota bacterium]
MEDHPSPHANPKVADDVSDGELFADLARILKSADMVFDVGANRAQFASRLLTVCDCPVYCFEPVPEDFDFLLELSSRDSRIKPFRLAITDDDVESIEFFINQSSAGSSLLAPLEGQSSQWLKPKEKVFAKASRLDWFIEAELERPKIDLLKIDAQG